MEDKILITVIGYGINHSAELFDEVSPEDFIETCCKMADSLSFSPEQVRQGLRHSLKNRE